MCRHGTLQLQHRHRKVRAGSNYGQGFEHILDEVDKQQLETERPVRTSMEADMLFGEKEQWLREQLAKKEAI